MKLSVICDNAENHIIECDLVVTDPPFDMCGASLAQILDTQKCDHLLLITTMRQLMGLCKVSNWKVSFDFVLDPVSYTHLTLPTIYSV